jgi:hypothetical protein
VTEEAVGRLSPEESEQQIAKGSAVVAFVEGQMKDKGRRPPWKEVLRRWNKAHPQQRYEEEAGFKKTYERAFRQIFAPLTEHLP